MEKLEKSKKRIKADELKLIGGYSVLLLVGLYDLIESRGSNLATIFMYIFDKSKLTKEVMVVYCAYDLLYIVMLIGFSSYNLILRNSIKRNKIIQHISEAGIIILFVVSKIALLNAIVFIASDGQLNLSTLGNVEKIKIVTSEFIGEPAWVVELILLSFIMIFIQISNRKRNNNIILVEV